MDNNLYIIWTDYNSVRIKILDEQHRGIVSTINSLHYFIRTGQSEDILRPTLKILLQYTIIHFRTEESIIAKAGYPGIEEHIRLHDALVRKTKRISLEIRRNKDPYAILKFLKEWWIGHINIEDKKYVSYLKKLIETKHS